MKVRITKAYEVDRMAVAELHACHNERDAEHVCERFAPHVAPSDRLDVWRAVSKKQEEMLKDGPPSLEPCEPVSVGDTVTNGREVLRVTYVDGTGVLLSNGYCPGTETFQRHWRRVDTVEAEARLTTTQKSLRRTMKGGTPLEVIRTTYGGRYRRLDGRRVAADTVVAALSPDDERSGEWQELTVQDSLLQQRRFVVHRDHVGRFMAQRPRLRIVNQCRHTHCKQVVAPNK